MVHASQAEVALPHGEGGANSGWNCLLPALVEPCSRSTCLGVNLVLPRSTGQHFLPHIRWGMLQARGNKGRDGCCSDLQNNLGLGELFFPLLPGMVQLPILRHRI